MLWNFCDGRFIRQFMTLTAAVVMGCSISFVRIFANEPNSADDMRHLTRQVHMGVEFTVIVHTADETLAEKATQAAFERIHEIDLALSDYLPESEVNRLCAQSPAKEPVKVSDDLFRVLHASLQLSERSDGAFDPTIGPLTKIWRRARRQKELPPMEGIEEARQAVGWRHVVLHEDSRSVELKRPKMRLDFGGIAKGYAADEGLAAIAKLGITRALVQASGDIAAGDPPPGLPGWKVALAPLNPDDPPKRFLWLKNQAVSTSGDARQHLIVNGRRYSHILDPRTGEPIEGRSAVSVIAPRGLIADGVATAIDVMGPPTGLALLNQYPKTAALVVIQQQDELATHISTDWNAVVREIDEVQAKPPLHP
jgi:thiamine biosynthesis lipoprotein